MIHWDTKVIRSTLGGLKTGIPLIVQQGSTSSGKTFGVSAAIAELADWHKDQTTTISVVGQTVPHLEKGALRDFEGIAEEYGGFTYKQQKKRFIRGKCKVEFFSIDKLGKAKGAKRQFLFINEANEIDYAIYKQLSLRTSNTTIIDYNPSGEFWFHDKVVPNLNPNEYLFKRTTYKDNPAVSEKIVRELEALKDVDEQLYRVYALGLLGKIEGLVFNVHRCDEIPKGAKFLGYGLDFGFTNHPTALIALWLSGGELYGRELIYETGLTNPMIAEKMRELGITKDDEIIADSAEPKSIQELKDEGFWVKPAIKGPDSVRFTINLLKKYKKNITNSSVNWHKEAKRYKWKMKDGKPTNETIKKFDHCWDAARYLIGYHEGVGESTINMSYTNYR